MTAITADTRSAVRLERTTLGWNVVGAVVLLQAGIAAGSVALLGFAFDTVLEIGASTVVLWELRDREVGRRASALRLLGVAFALLTIYLVIDSALALARGHHADASALGLAWTVATAGVMFALATGKRRVGQRLDNPVVIAEARVTTIDAVLACGVVAGLVLDTAAGLWWADASVGLVIAGYAAREAHHLLRGEA